MTIFIRNTKVKYGIAVMLALVFVTLFLQRQCSRNGIAVMYFKGVPEEGAIDQECVNFSKDVKFEVDFQPTEYNEIRKKLDPLFLAGRTEHDVLFVDDIWIREFAEKGWIENLNSYITYNKSLDQFAKQYSDPVMKAEAFWPVVSDARQGKIWAVPHRADVQVLYFNKSMFEDAEVKEAYRAKTGQSLGVPDTWDDYVNVAIGLNGLMFKGHRIIGCAETLQAPHYAFEFFACRYWAMSGDDLFQEDDTKRPLFASAAGVKVIEHFRRLKQAACWAPGSLTADHKSTTDAFGEGNVALCPQWYAWHAVLRNSLDARGSELGVTLIPGVYSEKRRMVIRTPSLGGGSLAISKFSRKKNQAWAFIGHFTSDVFSEKSALSGAIVPKLATWESDKVRSRTPYLSAYLKSLEVAKHRPRLTNFAAVETVLGSAIHDAIKLSEESALDQLQKAAQNIK